ncbi:3-phosphoglycerate dehydrogenase [Pyrodictium delaneyi]|uniref:3-phosphoglycerate dehydrogenase n=1 Tax=Pyrodictium delaneyi TaxID=1273541 RepID=A0A0P0N491_9CREN|nr:D-2-hydroxyacid dehydrogenase [Pyrodictium delaneyi]ALL01589.1 3-phosphoglycerate dehydrogenase [Pyrodictium delaneyi]
MKHESRALHRGGGAVGFGLEITKLEKLRPCLEGARVLVTDPVDGLLLEALKAAGLEVDYRPGITRGELLVAIPGYDALVVRSRTKVDRVVIERAERLKVIARAGVGLDNIDVHAAHEHGIRVVNAPGAATQSVAELTIALLIAAARRLHESIELARKGIWKKVMGVELYGKTLAVIGFGRIGRRVTEIAKAIGMDIIAYDVVDISNYAEKLGVSVAHSLHDALAEADAVTLHVPLTPDTYHLMSWDEFRVMKRGAILVNTSRGAVVDSEALLWALEEGIVGAAALDVLEHEPPETEAERKLAAHPRVILTTHIGASTIEAQRRVAVETARKLIEALADARGC